MSRHHAVLRANPLDRRVTIEDNDSMHGTKLHGHKLSKGQRRHLCQHDTVEFGQQVVRGHEKYPPLRLRVAYEWSSSIDQREPEKACFTNKFTADYSDEDDLSSGDEVQEIGRESFQGGLLMHASRPTSSTMYTSRISDHGELGVTRIEIDDDEYSPASSPAGVDSPVLKPSSTTDLSDHALTPDTRFKPPINSATGLPDRVVDTDDKNEAEHDCPGYYGDDSGDGSLDGAEQNDMGIAERVRDCSSTNAASIRGSGWENPSAPLTLHQTYPNEGATHYPWPKSYPNMPQLGPTSYTQPTHYGMLSTHAAGYPSSSGSFPFSRSTISYGPSNMGLAYPTSFAPAAYQSMTGGSAPLYPMPLHDSAQSMHSTSVPRPEVLAINSILNDEELQTRSYSTKEHKVPLNQPSCGSNEGNFHGQGEESQRRPSTPMRRLHASRSSDLPADCLPYVKPSKVVSLDLPSSSKKRTYDEYRGRDCETFGLQSGAQACATSDLTASTFLSKRVPTPYPSTEANVAMAETETSAGISEREGSTAKRPKMSNRAGQNESRGLLSAVAKYTATAAVGMALGALGTVYGLAALPLDYFA